MGCKTVVYGHNGSGKSTLSELLLSLAEGACAAGVGWAAFAADQGGVTDQRLDECPTLLPELLALPARPRTSAAEFGQFAAVVVQDRVQQPGRVGARVGLAGQAAPQLVGNSQGAQDREDRLLLAWQQR